MPSPNSAWWNLTNTLTSSPHNISSWSLPRINLYSILPSVQFSSVAQSCPTLCDPMDCSPPGSSIHGILRQEQWSRLTGMPGMLQFMGSQRVGHDWGTEQTELPSCFPYFLQFKSEFCNKGFMIWATIGSWSCFCWCMEPLHLRLQRV